MEILVLPPVLFPSELCSIKQMTDWKVLKQWNIAFCLKECFDHLNPHVHLERSPNHSYWKHFHGSNILFTIFDFVILPAEVLINIMITYFPLV